MKTLSLILCICLLPFSQVHAEQLVLPAGQAGLPVPGTMVLLSPAQNRPTLKGIKVDAQNPLNLNFIVDVGQSASVSPEQANELVKYFLAALTTPEQDLWVNLSPYEKDRIVPESFGQTAMGRDLLAQDYILKQVTASLVYPEGESGKAFWRKIYENARTKNTPINTFNKVWIVPDKVVIYENSRAGTAYVVESSLKVLTEQDYLAASKNHAMESNDHIVRDLVIPQLTKEVNEGANFAQLRQVYQALILATWYKKKINDSIIANAYAGKNKIKGVEYNDTQDAKAIYARYLEAFKKGAYNYIKEEQDPQTQQMIPRKYFSGGVQLSSLAMTTVSNRPSVNPAKLAMVEAKLIPDAAMNTDQAAESSRISNLLIDLASTDLNKRKAVAFTLPSDRANPTLLTQMLIKNIVEPIGIEEARATYQGDQFDSVRSKRNAQAATIFALANYVKTVDYNASVYKTSFDIDKAKTIRATIQQEQMQDAGFRAVLQELNRFYLETNDAQLKKDYTRWLKASLDKVLSIKANDAAMAIKKKSFMQYWESLREVVKGVPAKDMPWVIVPYTEYLPTSKPEIRITQKFVMGFSVRTVEISFSEDEILDLRIRDSNLLYNNTIQDNFFMQSGRSEQLLAIILTWLGNKQVFPEFKNLNMVTVSPLARAFFKRMVSKWRKEGVIKSQVIKTKRGKHSERFSIRLDLLDPNKIKKSIGRPYIRKPVVHTDHAMTNNGGIDLNPKGMDMQAATDSKTIQFKLDAAMLSQLEGMQGFTPQVLRIVPLPSGQAGSKALWGFLESQP